MGDLVMIRECQRVSKRKHFTVAEILEKSPAHLAEIELEQSRLKELQNTSETVTDITERSR